MIKRIYLAPLEKNSPVPIKLLAEFDEMEYEILITRRDGTQIEKPGIPGKERPHIVSGDQGQPYCFSPHEKLNKLDEKKTKREATK